MTISHDDDEVIVRAASWEKRALQLVVTLAAVTPVLVGVEGIISGPEYLGVPPPWPVDLDSHFRFFSGIFLAIGIAWYSCIPGIEDKTERFRLLAAFTFAGGVARLASLLIAGHPSLGHLAGLCMELIGVPLLVAWQARVARIAQISGMKLA